MLSPLMVTVPVMRARSLPIRCLGLQFRFHGLRHFAGGSVALFFVAPSPLRQVFVRILQSAPRRKQIDSRLKPGVEREIHVVRFVFGLNL